MRKAAPKASALPLLDIDRSLNPEERRTVAVQCHALLTRFRQQIAKGGTPSARMTDDARLAYLFLGRDPEPSDFSLKDYDHERYGPFLGVSDEGSATAAIRDAATASPKCLALRSGTKIAPEIVGVALDAERLGGIGEVAVGPDEYADVWIAAVDRVLITTNIGTRVNLRVYRREPRVKIVSGSPQAVAKAEAAIAAAFAPFTRTPDGRPRPLTVFVDIPRNAKISRSEKSAILQKLVGYVSSGKAAGLERCPSGQALGLVAWVGRGPAGREAAFAAIDLAANAGMKTVVLDGVKRRPADAAISLAGLLDYFAPGLVGPILRRAEQKGVTIQAANLSDTDTIARSIWSGLRTARSMGAHLGKYGCFPLTRAETDHVVGQVQKWFNDWSAAPAFFIDQGLLREGAVDVESDLPRGIELWLDTVSRHGVRVVLLDTIDKPSGRRLMKKSARDKAGYLGWRQVARIEQHARGLGVRVLWAGGLSLRDAFAMGKLGVFGIYVTSAVANTIAVPELYERDPMLPTLKEPSGEAVFRLKILLEAGFLLSRLRLEAGRQIKINAEALMHAVEAEDETAISQQADTLAAACIRGWRVHWKFLQKLHR
jgi:hypothetical protein